MPHSSVGVFTTSLFEVNKVSNSIIDTSMGTSFKILMAILGVLSAMNMIISYNQKPSKVRTFGVWFNGIALAFIAVALIIDLVMN